MDDLGFEEAVDRLGQGGVVAVTNAADRGLDACVRQPFWVFDRQVLAAPVAMMHEAHALDRAAFVDGLLKSIENEAGMRGGADTPTNDASGIGVEDESDMDEPVPCHSGSVARSRSSRKSTAPPASAIRAGPECPEPAAPRGRALRGKTCSLSCS